jgi:glycosyltransferase involved in cell wall biosynthesis
VSDLVLVSTRAEARAAARRLTDRQRLVALEWEAEDELEQLDAPFTPLHASLDEASFRDATERAYEWATGWHGGSEIAAALDAKGVALGRAVEYPVYYLLLTALRTAASFRRLVAAERPGRLVYFAKPASRACTLTVRDGDLFTEAALLTLAQQLDLVVDERPTAGEVDAPRGRHTMRGVLRGLARGAARGAGAFLRVIRPCRSGAICFLSVDGSVHPLYVPVVRALRRQGHHVVMLAAARGGRSSMGPPVVTVGDLVSPAERVQHRDRYEAAWPRIAPQLGALFVDGGLRLGDLILPGLEHCFAHAIPLAADVAEAVRRLHARTPVRALVGVNEIAEYFRAAMLSGDAVGVPSVTLLHGIPTRLHRFFIGNEPVIASRMAVWGEACRTVKIENGANPDRLVVTGAPHLSAVGRERRLRPDAEARVRALARFGLDPARRLVVFAPDHLNVGKLTHGVTLTPTDHAVMVAAVARAVAAIPGAQLLVKLKVEDQSGPRVRRLLRKHGTPAAPVIHDAVWPDLFDVADVVVMAHSTVGLEALLHGVPLVTVNFTGRPDRVDFAKSGVSLGVYEPAALREVLEAALFNPDVRTRLRDATPAFLTAFAGPLDGRSADRVAALVTGLAAAHQDVS